MTVPKNKGKRIVKVGAISYAQLIKLLLEGIYTCQELADETGLHYVTVLQYTRELHRAGAAYIAGWEEDCFGRDALKVYKLGAGKDKPRRQRTRAQIARDYRARRRARETLHMLAGQPSLSASSST